MNPTRDSTLADTQQIIADLQRRLTEADAERDEALAREAAAAEVLQAINSSPGDLAPVFDTILEKAHTLCGAAFGGLLIYDGARFKAVALHNVPPAFAEVARQPFRSTPNNPVQRLLEGQLLVHVADLKRIADAFPDEPMPRAALDLGGIRTLLMVPLRQDQKLLGVITAYRQEVRPFSDKQIALLQSFASQAVIAIKNARLITETHEALEQQTATAEVLQVINSSPGNLTPVFNAMLEKAMRLCGFDHGSLQTYDSPFFRAVAVRGLPEPLADQLRKGYDPTLWPPTRPLVDGARLVHVPDLTQEEQIEGVRLAVESGSRSLLFIPLRKDEALLGTIVAVRQEIRPFGEREIALLENFAAQAVIAMENARLITETREALEQQTAVAKILRVINSSPGDPQPLFDELVETAARLCETNEAGLAIRSGDSYHYVATRSLDPAWEARLSGFSFTPSRETAPVGHCLNAG